MPAGAYHFPLKEVQVTRMPLAAGHHQVADIIIIITIADMLLSWLLCPYPQLFAVPLHRVARGLQGSMRGRRAVRSNLMHYARTWSLWSPRHPAGHPASDLLVIRLVITQPPGWPPHPPPAGHPFESLNPLVHWIGYPLVPQPGGTHPPHTRQRCLGDCLTCCWAAPASVVLPCRSPLAPAGVALPVAHDTALAGCWDLGFAGCAGGCATVG